MKKMKLEGVALQHAKMLQSTIDNMNDRLIELNKEMERIREEANKATAQTMGLIKEALNIGPEIHAHVDATFLKDFDFAVVEIYDEDDPTCTGDHMEDIKSFLN